MWVFEQPVCVWRECVCVHQNYIEIIRIQSKKVGKVQEEKEEKEEEHKQK